MRKKYFITSLIFTAVSIAVFTVGLWYGFTIDILNIAKPITIFQYSTFLAFAFFVAANKEKLARSNKKDVYLIIGFFVAMLSFYEVLFNFFYWFSLYNFYGFGTNLDAVRNLISAQQSNILNITSILNITNQQLEKTGLYPVNLNFASKLTVMLFFSALYWIYVIHSVMKEKKQPNLIHFSQIF